MSKKIDLTKFAIPPKAEKQPTHNEEQAVEAIHTATLPPPSVSTPPVIAKTTKIATTRISLDTPDDVYLRLKRKAMQRKISLKAYILELIEKDIQ